MKDLVEKMIVGVGGVVVISLIIFCVSVLSGTILWMIYPHIHALFPTAADNGIIAESISWWDSVCVTWIFTILIKSSNTNNNDKKK